MDDYTFKLLRKNLFLMADVFNFGLLYSYLDKHFGLTKLIAC